MMKKLCLAIAILAFMWTAAEARDVHSFSCNDSNRSSDASIEPGRTEFVWTRNGETIFDRRFTDAYSPARNQYVSFYCEDNIIRYRLHSCENPSIRSLCNAGGAVTAEPVLNVTQNAIDSNPILLDGEGPKPVLRYTARSLNQEPTSITGLNFINNTDQNLSLGNLEMSAASQYRYTLMGPSGPLGSSLTTNNGNLNFNFSQNPLPVNQTGTMFELHAEPIASGSSDMSNIAWELNPAYGVNGVNATQSGDAVPFGGVQLKNLWSKMVFSRGIAGLKVDHFFPLPLFSDPSIAPQPFYRIQVQNISALNDVQLARLSIDMRLVGIKKNVGSININDISVVEIDDNNQPIATPNHQKLPINDSRIDAKSFMFMVELADFRIAANSVRYLEFRIANTVNDENGLADDDGVVTQMRTEESLNDQKSTYAELQDAMWVWTDFSGENIGGQRNDWRSGLGLEVDNQPVRYRE